MYTHGLCDSCGGIHEMMFGILNKSQCPNFKANLTPNIELIVPQVDIPDPIPAPSSLPLTGFTAFLPRPSFQSIFMTLAELISQRATCGRLKVGTVITTTDFRKVLAIGYNGNAAGLPNCCDRDEPGNCGCLHSEDNAVVNCDAPRTTEKFVFVTHLPCAQCAKRLINLGGVKTVYFKNDYRHQAAKDLFAKVGIELQQL